MSFLSKARFKDIQLLVQRIRGFNPKFKDEPFLKEFETAVVDLDSEIKRIDQLRAELKKAIDRRNDQSGKVRDLTTRIRNEVGVQYGLDSPQYDAVGRKRRSERKRPRPQNPSDNGA